MKSKLLPAILLLLVLLNGVLIFMLVTKPHQNRNLKVPRNFLTEQLQFSDTQQQKFIELDEIHKHKMIEIDRQIITQKNILFNAFDDKNINIDSLASITGQLEAQKDVEVYRFFNSVKEICDKEQQKKFTKIIRKALTRGKSAPLERQGNRPQRDGEMPPPPR